MTTFEIIVAVAIIAIVMLLTAIGTFVKGVWENQKSQEKKLDFINTQIAGIWRGQDKIENNAAILSSIVDKMHRNLCVEIADKMVDRAYPPTYVTPCIVETLLKISDALVAELKRSDDVYAECRRMDAINTASVCENMTKIQKELQKKGGQDESED